MEAPQPRATKDGPFCWTSKDALRLLAAHFGESNRLPAARTVYLALCELASNAGAHNFQAKVATIAKFAGVSTRTVHDVLPEMELIRVISVDRNAIPGSKMKAPSTYTLLAIRNGCTSIRDTRISIGDHSISICNRPESSVAENQKNLEKNLPEETIPAPLAPGFRVLSADVEKIYQAYPRKEKPVLAKKAIGKALKVIADRGTPDPVGWVLERVQAYASRRRHEDAKFTPYPASWFNAGSYDVAQAATPKRAL
jgi:hypothetical protein